MVTMDAPPSPPTPDAQAFGMLALDFARVLAVLAGTDALSLRHDIDPAGRYALTATPGNAMDKTGRPLRHAIFRILHGMNDYASVRNNPRDLIIEAAALTIRARTLPALLVLLQEVANDRGLVVDNTDPGHHDPLSETFQDAARFMLDNDPQLLLQLPATKTYAGAADLYAHIWDLASAPKDDRSVVHYGVNEIRAALCATNKNRDELTPVLRIH